MLLPLLPSGPDGVRNTILRGGPANYQINLSFSGEGGIRTLGRETYTRFPSVRLKPLGHLSYTLFFMKEKCYYYLYPLAKLKMGTMEPGII